MRILRYIGITLLLFLGITQVQAQGGCSTELEDISTTDIESLSKEYLRLASYKNPYCDTTGSDFELIMKQLEKQIVAAGSSKENVLQMMGTPYYHGPLAEYENQKLTIGRDGKPKEKSLPPSYRIPTGEYYVVYLWRKKDYLVFALKGGKVVDSTWWEKGNYR
jgi:hypothetical protein